MSEPTAYIAPDLDLRQPGGIDRLLAFHKRLFGGYVMEEGAGGETGGQGGQGGDGGQTGGTDSGDAGQGSGQQVDLSSLTADDLKTHPEFQSTVNSIVSERLKREKQSWQAKLDEEKRTAGLEGEQKWNAEKQQYESKLSEREQRLQAAHQLVAKTRAQVLAVSEGGRADRAQAIAAQADLAGAVDEDGNVDEAALKAAVKRVLNDYPEWKTDPGQGTPTRSGGELKTGGDGKPVITKSQVEAMSTEERVRRWEEIEAAMEDGRFDYSR